MPHPAETTTYRLAPSVAARFVGLALIAMALAMFLGTASVVLWDLPPDLLVGLLALGAMAVTGLAWWLRARAWVVRVDGEGYEIRLVRGAGERSASWDSVDDAVTTTRRGTPCLELRLRGGGATTIPVGILDVDKERFVRDLQARLQSARNLRPYEPPAGS